MSKRIFSLATVDANKVCYSVLTSRKKTIVELLLDATKDYLLTQVVSVIH